MRTRAIPLALALALPGLGVAADQNPIRIRGQGGELTIDRHGLALAPALPACPAVAPRGEPMWAVLLRPDTAPPVKGDTVVLTDKSQEPPTRESIPDGMRLVYERLSDGTKPWPVRVALEFRQREGGFEISGEIRNDAAGWLVCGFTGPVLDGVQTDLATHPLLMPEGFGRRLAQEPTGATKVWRKAGDRFEFDSVYPSNRGTMQWCAFAGPAGGLYVGCHDAEHGAKTFSARFDPAGKRLGLAIRHRACHARGARWALPPVVVLPYAGTWHAAARHYRAWVDRAVPVRDVPDWVRGASGWLLCILKQQNGEILWDYPSLGALCDVADRRGLDILGLFGWAHGGHDHLYPDYIPDEAMGGGEALRRALQEARRRGKRTILYANGQLIDRSTAFWREQGRHLAVIRDDGESVQQTWHKYRNAPAYQFDLACLGARGWRERMLALARQANDLGADGILYDQLGNTEPMPCYASGHGHPTPSVVYAADRRRFLREMADTMRSINPEFIVMTEGLHDSVLDSISLFHGCVQGTFAPTPGEVVARLAGDGRATLFPELFRVTYPETMSTIRLPTPMIDRRMANYACAFGLRYEIESRYAPDVRFLRRNVVPDAPDYAQVLNPPDVPMMRATPPEEAARYLARVVTFQRTHADLLWKGRFVDDQGFEFQGPGLVTKGYESDTRLGVVVWNPGDRPAPFTLRVPGARLESVSEPERSEAKVTDPVPAQSLRLIVHRKDEPGR